MDSTLHFEVKDQMDGQKGKKKSIHNEVPIFKYHGSKDSFKAQLSNDSKSFYARGNLVGQFYTF